MPGCNEQWNSLIRREACGTRLLGRTPRKGLQGWRPPIVRVIAHRGPGEQSAGVGGPRVCLRTAAEARGNC